MNSQSNRTRVTVLNNNAKALGRASIIVMVELKVHTLICVERRTGQITVRAVAAVDAFRVVRKQRTASNTIGHADTAVTADCACASNHRRDRRNRHQHGYNFLTEFHKKNLLVFIWPIGSCMRIKHSTQDENKEVFNQIMS